MDQMMPEISGMETAAVLRKMNYAGPIVALTANALVGQAEQFLKNGFDGFLSKPIQTVHLNAVLHKFVKDKHVEAGTIPAHEAVLASPAGEAAAGGAGENLGIDGYFDNYLKNSGIYDKTRKDFARSQKDAIPEMASAIKKNDYKTAHRLVHTLKGLAALIGEKNLEKLAAKTETTLDTNNMLEDLMCALGSEMERVLAKIKEQYPDKPNAQPAEITLDKGKAGDAFDRLTQFLEGKSFDALKMCDEIAEIPQTGDLIRQIEDIDFVLALETLGKLRRTLEV